jgi:hypothetical protein
MMNFTTIQAMIKMSISPTTINLHKNLTIKATINQTITSNRTTITTKIIQIQILQITQILPTQIIPQTTVI